jgi:hypothetical protein
MAQHRASCAACDAMTRELEQIIAEAAALPPLSPPRDLWAGIEARLEAEVVPLPTAARHVVAAVAPSTPSAPMVPASTGIAGWSARRLAIAAAALVTVTAGVTWQLANRGAGGTTPAPSTASVSAPAATQVATAPTLPTTVTDSTTQIAPKAEIVVGTPERATTTLTSRSDAAVAPEVTYEREISALRRIVDERFAELDSSTVTELRRNIRIIDQAIADSRKALAKDPRSAFVSLQLDRALQAKLELLRRVALL